jgi:hypothetical protein
MISSMVSYIILLSVIKVAEASVRVVSVSSLPLRNGGVRCPTAREKATVVLSVLRESSRVATTRRVCMIPATVTAALAS